jgi:hypothetical protein
MGCGEFGHEAEFHPLPLGDLGQGFMLVGCLQELRSM